MPLLSLGTTAQEWAQKADDAVLKVGNAAQQIANAAGQLSGAINTPLVVTTPTPTRPLTVRPALPTEYKIALALLAAFILYKAVR